MEAAMPVLGKRYACAVCGTTTLCLRPGKGKLTCCGQEMKDVKMEPLPSGD
jgi:desulfoferrodoxin-like iron-binding protein